MKKWARALIIILMAVLILGFAKDLIIKTAVEAGVQVATGLKLETGAFKIGLLNTLIDIRNLRILNPAGFKDKYMLNMPEIYVDYDLPAIFKGKVHLTEVRINMSELTVVKNEKGALNLDSLKAVQSHKAGGKAESKPAGKAPDIKIDKLRLKIGKVFYKDYSAGSEPKVAEFNVDIDEEYSGIDNPYELGSLIIVKALTKTSIARLANFDIKGMSSSVSDVLASAQKMSAQVGEAQKAATEYASQAQKAVSDLQDTLKNSFGSGQ